MGKRANCQGLYFGTHGPHLGFGYHGTLWPGAPQGGLCQLPENFPEGRPGKVDQLVHKWGNAPIGVVYTLGPMGPKWDTVSHLPGCAARCPPWQTVRRVCPIGHIYRFMSHGTHCPRIYSGLVISRRPGCLWWWCSRFPVVTGCADGATW